MTVDPLDAFRDLLPQEQQRTYPGSKKIRQTVVAAERAATTWDTNPYRLTVDGVVTDLYDVAALADAVGHRSPATMRKWEQLGHLPPSDYRYPSHSPRARRRLYTRVQIEKIIQIAKEEGVYDGTRKIRHTQFAQRVAPLFAAGRKRGKR